MALQFLVSYTYGKSLDYGSSAASGGGAVGGGQTVTNMDAWHGPSGYDMRHRASISYVYELPFGTGRRWMSDAGGILEGIVGGWQLSGITTLTTGRPFTVTLQTGVNNGAPSWPNRDRFGRARQADCRSLVQHGRLRGAAAKYLRRQRTRHPLRTGPHATSMRRCRSDSSSADVRMRSSGGTSSTCSTIPGFGFPNSAIGNADRGPHHDDHRRQPQHAVRAEGQFLSERTTGGTSREQRHSLPRLFLSCMCVCGTSAAGTAAGRLRAECA